MRWTVPSCMGRKIRVARLVAGLADAPLRSLSDRPAGLSGGVPNGRGHGVPLKPTLALILLGYSGSSCVENLCGNTVAYLQKRHRKYWAHHDIPKDLRPILGQGVRFSENLETDDLRTANGRKAALEPGWRQKIEAARRIAEGRQGTGAEWWANRLAAASDADRPDLIDSIKEEAQEIAREGGSPTDPDADPYPNHAAAERFYAMATGKMTRFDAFIDDWVKTLRNEPKSVAMKHSNVLKFAAEFPYVQDVRRKEVQRWANQHVQAEKQPATIQRMLSELRGYWRYLVSIEAASEDLAPFDRLTLAKVSAKDAHRDRRRAFTAKEVVGLLAEAVKRKDDTLADLIRLEMWTGARIEELCALKVEDATATRLDITDAKTPAGVRQVPVHPKLAAVVRRLKRAKGDGYLLSGLSPDKYGNRSPAIGKRFGRMKTDLGFGEQHVFHSIRKTVVTLFENKGVPENVAMDIIGHDKPTLTYGHYSEGNTFDVMRRAVEKLEYPR